LRNLAEEFEGENEQSGKRASGGNVSNSIEIQMSRLLFHHSRSAAANLGYRAHTK